MKQQSEEQMSSVRNLVPVKGWYHSRVVVPKALRPFIGKSELWIALDTASRSEAIRRHPAALARQRAQIEVARAQADAAQPRTKRVRAGWALSPRQLAVAHYETRMAFDDEIRNSDGRATRGFVDMARVGALREVIAGGASVETILSTVGAIAGRYSQQKNLPAPEGTPEWREAIRALAVAELESLARTAERDDGDFAGKPSHPLLAADPAPAVGVQEPQAGRIVGENSTKPLRDIVPLFIKEKGASGQTNNESENTVRMFEEVIGEPLPAYKITRQNVHAFKAALQELPVSATKRFPDLTVPEAIKANKRLKVPYPALNTRTINEKYLSRLHSLLNWCVRNDVIPDNPAAGIKIDTVKGKAKPPRVPFAPSDLMRIFAPENFDKSKPFTEEQWAPLCALFTGARASELAQIKLDSIQTMSGYMVIAIEEETKTASSQRLVPIHSTLLALGLDKRIAMLRAKKETHLFPEWYRQGIEAKAAAEAKGKFTLNQHFPKFIPRRFNVTFLPNVGIDDPRKRFHSFRHTFKTGLKNCGVDKAIRDELAGHDDKSAGAGYEHGFAITVMKEAIEKLRYDGFTLESSSPH